ncbi:MAG: phosphoethanolamine--lipid A transferase [Xanthomonadaceae bacterium]|nr:phosphoethanolamine--lipid A transferase [Xanthomonadaceae bacterium]
MNASTIADRPSPWKEHVAAFATWRPRLSAEMLILVSSLYFVLFSNAVFWKAAVPIPTDWTWTLSMFLLVTAIQGIWLSMLVWQRTARIVLTTLILASALANHYMAAYGIYINADMIRNVLNTDWHEATDLVGVDVLRPILLTLPAIVVLWRVSLRHLPWRRALLARLVFVLAMVLIGIVGAFPSLQPLTSFLRNQREVRYLVTPTNMLVSLAKVVSEEPPGRTRVQLPIGEDAMQSPPATMRKPRLLVLVVGETARAAHWGLNGYARQTTPELARRNVLNFPHVTACGSSTEVSLPCMFSPYGRENYNEKAIRGHESLMHVLQRAGISTLWRDNQSGCKGVCTGLRTEDMQASSDPELCLGKRCYDGILLEGLDEAVEPHGGDRVIVLHMLGNHGPNYFERYPPAFRRYTPVCETSDLGRCSRGQIINAYDNALLYTDHVLAGAIDRLETLSGYDTALLYVSDHGESLGEKGLYLHGMPYAIAPEEQLQVPMVAWFSDGWRRSTGLDAACLRRQSMAVYSHDNLFHTLLGLTDVKTALYRPDDDVFLTCRAGDSAASRDAP